MSGIERHTLIEWEAKYLDLTTALERAKAEYINSLSLSIYLAGQGIRGKDGKVIANGDWRAHAWLLERADPEHYSLTQKIDNRGNVKYEFTGERAEAIVRLCRGIVERDDAEAKNKNQLV